MKKEMPKLFNIDIPMTDEERASKFISKLQEMDFVGVNMVYLTNYIDADLSIGLGHIKDGYKRYVATNKWSEEKYLHIVLMIARNREMMIPVVFMKYGIKYDEGKLAREVNLELQKYEKAKKALEEKKESKGEEKNEISKEEQELLDYIARNGGV